METEIVQKRGQLTDRVKDKSKELLGYEISVRELRLMPYVQYEMMNSGRAANVNSEEIEILASWVEKGFIAQGVTVNGRPMMSTDNPKIRVTKEFWDAMSEILWLSYVDLSDE